MKILSNLDESKFREFVNTLFPDIEDTVEIKDNSTNEEIMLVFKNDNNRIEFRNPVLYDISKQKQAMYKTGLLKLYNRSFPWGGLVGVRPTKLIHALRSEGKNIDEIKKILFDVYFVSEEKVKLLLDTVENSIEYIDKSTVGVYLGIAFCPTKCTYCSFPAYLKKGKYEKGYDEYILTLLRETREIGQLLTEIGVKINTIYIGGGTPSFLSEDELTKLMEEIRDNFDLSYLEEFTFEAGRIDTITLKKLEILKSFGVDRISINPQSFKEQTLRIVNRYHNIEKLNEVFYEAMRLGFIINMDYILSLPRETTEDILNTIEKMKEYPAQNITIHNLALKKSSYLTKTNYKHSDLDYVKIYKKIYEFTKEYNYIPYYLYRQKNSESMGENVGFCKPGYQSRYNIDMIEENKNIFGIGAGSMTKLISIDNIERVSMPKDPLSYVLEFEERLEKKKEIIRSFYGEKR